MMLSKRDKRDKCGNINCRQNWVIGECKRSGGKHGCAKWKPYVEEEYRAAIDSLTGHLR